MPNGPTYAAPVAAPRVIKEVADKDRRSRMAYSTYHQEPKKGGAGGAYTWGSAGDVLLGRSQSHSKSKDKDSKGQLGDVRFSAYFRLFWECFETFQEAEARL